MLNTKSLASESAPTIIQHGGMVNENNEKGARGTSFLWAKCIGMLGYLSSCCPINPTQKTVSMTTSAQCSSES
jgi:hypothetical protein